MKEKSKMGRPPSPWVRALAECSLIDSKYIDAYALSSELGVASKSVINFLQKLNLPRKYEVVGKTARAVYQVKDLKEAARKHLEPWL